MNVGMRVRGGLFAALIMFAMPVAATLAAMLVSSPAAAQTVASIQVEGNRRVEIETIRSYFKPGPGGRLDQGAIDDGLKALIETGLFQDVKINQAGGHLVVTVIENPVIGRVAFEGNKKVKDEQLSAEIQSKPRGTLSRPMVQSDAQRIAEIYRHSGRYDVRVNPEIIEQPNNRVDLVFTITEGAKTGVKSIEFIGNNAYSSYRLKDVIKTHEIEFAELSRRRRRLRSGPGRSRPRPDSPLLPQARLCRRAGGGRADRIRSGQEGLPGHLQDRGRPAIPRRVGQFPVQHRHARRQFAAQLLAASMSARSTTPRRWRSRSRKCRSRPRAAAMPSRSCSPRGDRNFDAHTVSITFAIDEGPRVYIERINIRGNTRTRDYVIRREFDISEGDAYNRALVDRAERRLKNLDFFKTVKITTEPGSSSDRVVLNVDLEEKSTGDFSVSGGYSTTDGALAEVSISERNLLGRGLFAKASVTYGQYARGISLSFVEPYLLDYRVALGLDVFYREQLRQQLYFVRHQDDRLLARGWASACARICRCSCAIRSTSSRSRCRTQLDNCNNLVPAVRRSTRRRPISTRCWAASIPTGNAPNGLLPGCLCATANRRCRFARNWRTARHDLVGRLHAELQHARQQQEPDRRSADRLQAGFRRRRRRRQLSEVARSTRKYYTPLVADIVGLVHLQGGMLNQVGNNELRMLDQFQMGPNLVRGFAPNGIGPRDLTFFPYTGTGDALGGTKYWGASAELQMPFWFLPKEVGLKGAVYADAGSLWDYKGPTVMGRDR